MRALALAAAFLGIGMTAGWAGEGEAMKPADALTVIHNRKSVRSYTDATITRDELTVLIRAGMAAPSGVDARPWVFVVVDDRKILDNLAEGLPYAKMLKQAPAAIIVCGDLTNLKYPDLWMLDCAAASQNILLAAEATGLGAVWTAAWPDKDRIAHVQKTLVLPEKVIPLNVIPVGRPAGETKPKDKWDPTRIHWNQW